MADRMTARELLKLAATKQCPMCSNGWEVEKSRAEPNVFWFHPSSPKFGSALHCSATPIHILADELDPNP